MQYHSLTESNDIVNDNLVDVTWLGSHLNDDNVAVVDGSWHLPSVDRHAREEYTTAHIPGAVYFDIDQCVTTSALPHMLPAADTFADYAGSLGITERQHIVVYDSVGVFSAARIWWMFRRYGAKQVSVLNGGLPAWIKAGHPQDAGITRIDAAVFNASVNSGATTLQLADAPQVQNAMTETATVILDARSPGRFSGVEKEFRPGLRSGHIPGSRNVPFTDLLENGFFKSDEQLRDIFAKAGAEGDKHVITSCGSGVTAAILCLALERIGVRSIALYDGSWTEWGGLADMPVDTTV